MQQINRGTLLLLYAYSMSAPRQRWPPLSGGTAVWIFMTVEVVTFGLFLLGHAWQWTQDPDAMAAAQAQLELADGAINTLLLLVGSGLAYLGVLGNRLGRRRPAAMALATAAALGLAFAVHKVGEWLPHLDAGLGLSSGPFWFSYFFLTQLHFLHVLPGIGALCWGAWAALRQDAPGDSLDTIAAYWHLVDVVWLLLFTIIYVMHP